MTDEKIIEALYKDTPLTLPHPAAGMAMSDFWESTIAGHWLLFLMMNVAPKLRRQLVSVAVRCTKLALEQCNKDQRGEGATHAARAVEVVEQWLQGAASVEKVHTCGMDAVAFSRSGPRPDLQRDLADAAAWTCFTARNAGYYDEDAEHGRPDRSRPLVLDALSTQEAAVRALVEGGLSLDEARRRTIAIVRNEFPWSVIEPHARALAEEVPGEDA